MKRIALVIVALATWFMTTVAAAQNREAPASFPELKEMTRDSSRLQTPEFPPPDQIEKMKKRTSAPSNSGVFVCVGGVLLSTDNKDLNTTYRAAESTYGVTGTGEFKNTSFSFSLGLRLGIAKRTSLWWDYVYAGSTKNGSNRQSCISLSLLLDVLGNDERSLVIGIGGAIQRLRARRDYNVPLDDGGTLEHIDLDSGPQFGVPFTAAVRFHPDHTSNDGEIFVAATFFLIPVVKDSKTYSFNGQSYSFPVRLNMNTLKVVIGVGMAI